MRIENLNEGNRKIILPEIKIRGTMTSNEITVRAEEKLDYDMKLTL